MLKLGRIRAMFLVASVFLIGATYIYYWGFIFPLTKTSPIRLASHSLVEITQLEILLNLIVSDAKVGTFKEMYRPVEFAQVAQKYAAHSGLNAFEASAALYSRTTNELLVYGYNAPSRLANLPDQLSISSSEVLNTNATKLLRSTYSSSYVTDPWGNSYRFFVGPWPSELGPVLFRTYGRTTETRITGHSTSQLEDNAAFADGLTIIQDDIECGFPAAVDQEFYIWSFGANGLSDQPLFDPALIYAAPTRRHYRENAPHNYHGGGDDINNWDKMHTFFQFYN